MRSKNVFISAAHNKDCDSDPSDSQAEHDDVDLEDSEGDIFYFFK